MPARDLRGETLDAARLDVVGTRGDERALTHAGLLSAATRLVGIQEADVFDMASELRLSPPGRMRADVVGWLPLSRDESDAIDEWLADFRTRILSCTYYALPSAELMFDGNTGRPRGWRFSCAGFVKTAYEAAGVALVVEEAQLPVIDFPTICRVWAIIVAGRPQTLVRSILERYGLRGPGPWPVLVPGYLMHALNGERSELPHRPTATEITFP